MVVLAAVIARELGGGRSAQVLAATAVAISGVLLATGHLLATATFDFLAWTALTAIVVHVWRTGRTRWWIVAGVVAGVGLENKHSVAFLLVGLGVGMLVARRDLLRDPWCGPASASRWCCGRPTSPGRRATDGPSSR
jgi:4-amino-4-deoxy-L-arabinose transferase-like glycosyltransferase